MITGPIWFGVKAAQDYPQDDDYHSGESHDNAPNEFGGELSRQLGLKAWSKEAYADALRGKLPGVKDRLAMTMDGTRAACDFTCNAPKSVSLAALVLGHDAAAIAHERASAKAAEFLGNLAQYRITESGLTRTERAVGALYSKFTHATSRKRDPNKGVGPGGDPHLHSHFLFLNYVQCPDGKLRALENYEMLRARLAAGAVYRAELAKELQKAGYKLKFNDDAFEIEGIPNELNDHFSSGRKSIVEAAKSAGLNPERLSARQREVLNKAERDSKLKLDRAGLRQFWSDRAEAIGLPLADIKVARAELAVAPYKPLTALEAVEVAMSMRTERSSTIRHDYDLVQDALHASNYSLTLTEVQEAIAFKKASGSLIDISASGKMTTLERLANEKAIDRLYDLGLGVVDSMGTKDQAIERLNAMEARMSSKAFRTVQLTDGQRNAVIAATLTRNRVLVWEGDAGVGKSTSFEAVLAIATANGFNVRGLGPHGKAVDALKESGLEAWTAQKAYASEAWWKDVGPKTIIVVDEFGKVDVACAKVILERAEKAGARVITSGDTKQWAAVGAGSPAHQVYANAKKSGDLCVLDEMMRAAREDGRRLHNMSRDNAPESVLEMFRQDRVRAFANANQRFEYIGREFAKLDRRDQDKSMVITGMNCDRVAINAAVRKHLRLGTGLEVETYNDKKLEKAALRNFINYNGGDVIRFGTNHGPFKKGESVRIVSNDTGNLVVKRKHGSQESVQVEDIYTRIGLGSSETIRVAEGELIQFTSPIESLGITTKAAARVESLDSVTRAAQVRILGDDRLVKVELREFGTAIRYGYCQTSDGAQGSTVKGKLWCHMTSDDPTVQKNAWYTNNTRMTDQYELVTDMREGDRILAMQTKVSKALAPDFADPKRKPADTSVAKVAFQAGNRIWANAGAEHIRVDSKVKDLELLQALVGARDQLGDKWHVTGTREFQLRVARLVGQQDGLRVISFRHPKLNAELAESRASAAQRRITEGAAELSKLVKNGGLAAQVESVERVATPSRNPGLPMPEFGRDSADSGVSHSQQYPKSGSMPESTPMNVGSSLPAPRSTPSPKSPRAGASNA